MKRPNILPALLAVAHFVAPPFPTPAQPIDPVPATSVKIISTADGFVFREGTAQIMAYQLKSKSLEGKFERANYIHPLYDLWGNVLTEDFPKDHPQNPGAPQPWILRAKESAQNAAYPGREPMLLSTNQPLVLRYRVFIHDGTITPAQLDNLLRDYAAASATNPRP